MKNIALLLIISGIFFASACNKVEKSERFLLLTRPEWKTDSLSANGVDAGVPGGMLEKFEGNAKFKEDGTGNFGTYTGTWRFNIDETKITIVTDSMPLPIITDIIELTNTSLKISTLIPNPVDQVNPFHIRMTFTAK